MKTHKTPIYADHLTCYTFAAHLIRSRRVLELGCGEGYGGQILSLFASSYTGLDVSQRYINVCEKKQMYCPSTFRVHDLEKQPLDLSDTDIVVAFETLEHIDNPEDVLRQIHEAGKHFIFSVPHNYPHPLHKRVFKTAFDVIKILPSPSIGGWYSLADSLIHRGIWKPECDRYIVLSEGLLL